jgi:hypothetical protein
MINNLNEIIIFFLIVIFIILSYYDLKYSIIFAIVLFLLYIYSNKIILEPPKNYTNYNNNIESIFNKLKKYKKIDTQSYKLGLKYYKYFIKNIELLYTVNDYIKFNSLLENSKVYLDTSIEHFNSILFLINTYDHEYEKEFIKLMDNLKIESNKILQETETKYNDIKKYNDNEGYNYNMFFDNDPQIELFISDNVKPDIYNKSFEGYNMFNTEWGNKIIKQNDCNDPYLLYPITLHKKQLN